MQTFPIRGDIADYTVHVSLARFKREPADSIAQGLNDHPSTVSFDLGTLRYEGFRTIAEPEYLTNRLKAIMVFTRGINWNHIVPLAVKPGLPDTWLSNSATIKIHQPAQMWRAKAKNSESTRAEGGWF